MPWSRFVVVPLLLVLLAGCGEVSTPGPDPVEHAPTGSTPQVTTDSGLRAPQDPTPTGLPPLCLGRGWALTGSLAKGRGGHTATLLRDGTVLVVGGTGTGTDASQYLATAELYDPARGTWSPTGSLAQNRTGHTATLLRDGKVLVAGGYNGERLHSAELYNPNTGTWSPTGSLVSIRKSHSATLLGNGEVLITGGSFNGGSFNPDTWAELYDPSTGSFRATNYLLEDRWSHTATLLGNGKVLVAGGLFADHFSTTEMYDPARGSRWAAWSAAPSMASARGFHTATLLSNGKVLVAGGFDDKGTLAAAEVYDPITGVWSVTGAMNGARGRHTATTLSNGKVFVAGGFNSSGSGTLATAELYDPAKAAWNELCSMISARNGHTATLLPSGKVLVAGGSDGGYLATAEVYTP